MVDDSSVPILIGITIAAFGMGIISAVFGIRMLIERKSRKNPSDSDTDADRMVDYCGIVVVDPRDFRDAAGTCPVSPGVGGNGFDLLHSEGNNR